jgi:ubiquinone/menaquinone biosynthesis C-methylase UbiE
MPDFSVRSNETELMDDLSRPDSEFADAYSELTATNRYLGGVHAIERFLPDVRPEEMLTVLDVASGGCDVGEALAKRRNCRIVSLDLNPRGLKLAERTAPVVGDAVQLPFADNAFDVVICSLFFHHLMNSDCVRVFGEMWRVARRMVIVNDLHRNRVAHASIRILAALFSRSSMFRNDAPASVRRAFRPSELLAIAEQAGIPARVHRSFPYRLVLVATK